MKKITVIAVLFFTICTALHAGDGDISVHTFTDSEGFHHNKVTGICQDNRGFIWLSSWNGLYRWDGLQFTGFRPTQSEGSSNGDDRLDEARTDSYGNIWCRSYHHPYMFDVRNAIFRDIGTEIEKSLGHTLDIRRIICAADAVWLQSDDSIAVRCTAGNTAKPVIFSPSSPWRLCQGKIISIKTDTYNRAWIISDSGITVVDSGGLSSGYKLTHIPGNYLAMEETHAGEYHLVTKSNTIVTITMPYKAGADKIPMRLHKTAIPARYGDIQRTVSYADGELALATSAGIMIHSHGKWLMMRYRSRVRKTLRIKRDDIGRYWIVTDRPGITLAEPEKKNISHMLPPPQGAYINKRNSWFFHPLPCGDMLVMTQNGGLCRYNTATKRLERIKKSDGRLYLPQVGRSFSDTEGNLWLFNEPKYVDRISPGNSEIKLINDGCATRLLFRDSTGKIWRSTDNGRLIIYNAKGHPLGFLTPNGTRSTASTNFPIVYSMTETAGGTLWLGTKEQGLCRLQPRGNGSYAITRHTAVTEDHTTLHANDIFSLATDHNGRLWIGTYSSGLFLCEKPSATKAIFRKVKGMPQDFRSNNIRTLLCLSNGIMAAGTSNGILTFVIDKSHPHIIKPFHNRRETWRHNSLSNNVIMSLFEDSRKYLYIITPTSGICHAPADSLLRDNIPFHHISTHSGAPSDMATAIYEDTLRRLWIAHSNGIARLATNRKKFDNHLFPYGDTTPIMATAGIVPLADGSLVIGTDNGIAVYRPTTQNVPPMPRIAVTEISVCGRQRATDFDFSDTLRLNSDERDLTISIAAIITSGNSAVKYASRTDTTQLWTIHGNNPQLSLLNLTPGWHRLQIKSTDSSGAWTDNVRTLHIHVRPTFWETPWATMLYVTLIILAAATVACVWAYVFRLRLKLQTHMENIKMRMNFINNIVPELHSDNTIEQARHYIDSRLADESLTIPDIAAHVGMSVAAFRARFKELTGVSPVEFLRHYRIEVAKNLLLTSSLTVAEVAYKCGFSDPKYFSRVFKTIEGMSPSAFKDSSRSMEHTEPNGHPPTSDF